MKILLAGTFSSFSLETSYRKGFEANGHDVKAFDLRKAIAGHVRFGKIGRTVNSLLPVEPWAHKGNREFVILAKEFQPDVIVVSANTELLPGSIAFVKSIMPVKVVLIWPDTLFNLGKNVLMSAPFFDHVACHSNAAVDILRQYGFKQVTWLPFGGDLDQHYGEPTASENDFTYDLTFVGANRPERERVVDFIIRKFPDLRVKVWGNYWDRSPNKAIKKIANFSPLFGKDFTKVVQSSLINLNIIDDTNYPGSNMRFFEIPAAGGLQLCSACPEMEGNYKNGEDLFYFHSEEELASQIEFCLKNKSKVMDVGRNFHNRILKQDNYKVRAQQLLNLIN